MLWIYLLLIHLAADNLDLYHFVKYVGAISVNLIHILYILVNNWLYRKILWDSVNILLYQILHSLVILIWNSCHVIFLLQSSLPLFLVAILRKSVSSPYLLVYISVDSRNPNVLVNVLYNPHSSVAEESTCNAGDLGSIPGLGRSPGEGNGNPLQYSCLESPMDRGAGQAIVHGVANSRMRLSN